MKQRQICTVFLAFMPIIKIVSAPAVLSGICGEKLWQPLVILFVLDIALIFFLLGEAKRSGSETFFAILENSFSKGFARVVYGIYAVYFALKAYLPLLEHKEFVENAFYEIMPDSFIYFPVFIITFYMSLKGLKILGRASEFCVFITAVGMLTVLYLSLGSGDYSALLPLFYGTGTRTLTGTACGVFWFSDAVYLLFFMGHFKPEKYMRTQIVLSYAASAALITLFYVCYYSIFSSVAVTQKFAVSAMSIFSVTLVNVGRFDYVAMFMLVFTGVFATSIPIMLSSKCLERAANTENSLVPSIIVNITLAVATIIFSRKYVATVEFFEKYLSWFFLFAAYVMPLLSLFGGKKRAYELQKS